MEVNYLILIREMQLGQILPNFIVTNTAENGTVCGVKLGPTLEVPVLVLILTETGVMNGEEKELATIPARKYFILYILE